MINSSSDSFSIPKNNSGFTDFSVDSDRSIPKKFLQTTQNNTKFLGNIEPNEGLEINSNIQINLDYSSFSPINDRNIKSDNLIKINPIGSPIRSAIKKSPTCFFNNSNDNTPVHDNSPEGGFNKKRTIKFGEKEEIRFFTMKEGTATDKNTNTINIEKDKESRMSSTSRSQKGLSSGTSKDDDKLNTKEKKEASFGKNITILMIINHFLKNLKLKSGRFGRLGMKQCKIVNDFAHDVEVNAEEDFEMETNLMARMIKKFRATQLKKENEKTKQIKNFFKSLFAKFQGDFLMVIPDNKFKIVYNMVIFCLTMAEFIYIPFGLCFNVPNEHNWYIPVRIYIYLIYCIDIFFNFNTGYYNKGTLILTRKEVVKYYMKFRFWFDLITVVPLLVNIFQGFIDKKLKFFQFVFLLRIFYLNEMIRKICDFYNSGELINSVIGLIKLCILTMYVAHICACLWHYISLIDSESYQVTWLTVFLQTEEEISVSNEYITSLYWAVTTMITVGYGDIIPRTPNEKMFAIISMLLACCVFAYIMNSIGLVINSFNNRQAILRHKIQAVNKYLDMKNIDYDLRIRIRKYLEYLYEEKNALVREGQIVVMNLSAALKTEIFQRLNSEIIGKIPILIKIFTPKLLSQLTLLMKEVSFTPEDLIFSENDLNNQDLFYIYEGEVEIFIENFSGFKEDTTLTRLKKGDFFGEISFFSNQPRSASSKSLGFSNLISLSREDFLNIIRNFSYDYEKYCMISDNINLYKNYFSIYIKCLCCNITNHLAIECPMVHINLNKDRIIRNHIDSEPNQREEMGRRAFKKFKVLKNLQKLVNATIKIHRTTTFEMYNDSIYPDEEDDEQSEEIISWQKNIKNERKIGRKISRKIKGAASAINPIRKSKSYTNRNIENIISKTHSNIIYEEISDRNSSLVGMNENFKSKDTLGNELKLISSNNQMLSSRNSLLSPTAGTIYGQGPANTNPNLFSYFSIGPMSTIEKKQDTYISESNLDYLSPSNHNNAPSIIEPSNKGTIDQNYFSSTSKNMLKSSSINDQLESFLPSDMIDISEDQESMNSSIAPQKSKKGISSIINIQSPNPGGSVISIKQTNVNISVNPPAIKKEDKKKEGIQNISTIQNFAFNTKAKDEFELNFDKMKIFDVYFVHNNVNFVLEEYKKLQIKYRKNLKKLRSSSQNQYSRSSPKKLSEMIKNLPLFKRNVSTLQPDDRNLGDGNFLKRRESVSYSKSKTNNFSKKMTIHKNHKKCFSCACCSKKIKNDHKTNKDLAKRKQSLGERRVSVAERLRRASMTAREDN